MILTPIDEAIVAAMRAGHRGHRAIAAACGVSSGTVYRHVSHLKAAGVITRDERVVEPATIPAAATICVLCGEPVTILPGTGYIKNPDGSAHQCRFGSDKTAARPPRPAPVVVAPRPAIDVQHSEEVRLK